MRLSRREQLFRVLQCSALLLTGSAKFTGQLVSRLASSVSDEFRAEEFEPKSDDSNTANVVAQ